MATVENYLKYVVRRAIDWEIKRYTNLNEFSDKRKNYLKNTIGQIINNVEKDGMVDGKKGVYSECNRYLKCITKKDINKDKLKIIEELVKVFNN